MVSAAVGAVHCNAGYHTPQVLYCTVWMRPMPVNLEQVRHGMACGSKHQEAHNACGWSTLIDELHPQSPSLVSNRISDRNIVPVLTGARTQRFRSQSNYLESHRIVHVRKAR